MFFALAFKSKACVKTFIAPVAETWPAEKLALKFSRFTVESLNVARVTMLSNDSPSSEPFPNCRSADPTIA